MSIKELNARIAADDLVEFLKDHPGNLACVHSVFPHAVNLLIAEDELITLTNQDDITPMGLVVDYGTSFAEILKPGDKIILNSDQFTALNGLFMLNLRDAEVWETGSILDLGARRGEDIADLRFKLIGWLGNQLALGLLPLLPRLARQSMKGKPVVDNLYSRYIADDLETFTKAINGSDWKRALHLADRLVGFGMGSTPACDDFLAAYLVVFAIFDVTRPGQYPWIQQFNQTIASKAKKRSTLISANMLRHAAQGKMSKSHQGLIQTCLFNNQGNLEQSAAQVMRHGATSGRDFLLGLVCALEWVQNIMTDISKEGEQAWVELKQPQPVPGI